MGIIGNLGLLALAAGFGGMGWGFGAAWAIRKIVSRRKFEWSGVQYRVEFASSPRVDPSDHAFDVKVNVAVKGAMSRGDYDATIARIIERNSRRRVS